MKAIVVCAVVVSLCTADGRAAEDAGTRARRVRDALDIFSLSVSIRPTQPNQGLRSVLLYTSPQMTIEPHGFWPNGAPVSADVRLLLDEASRLIDVLELHRFFERAGKYYSGRRRVDHKGAPPPAGATDYLARLRPVSTKPGYDVRVTVFDEHWYTYYVATVDASEDRSGLLRALRDASTGTTTGLLSKLMLQLK